MIIIEKLEYHIGLNIITSWVNFFALLFVIIYTNNYVTSLSFGEGCGVFSVICILLLFIGIEIMDLYYCINDLQHGRYIETWHKD